MGRHRKTSLAAYRKRIKRQKREKQKTQKQVSAQKNVHVGNVSNSELQNQTPASSASQDECSSSQCFTHYMSSVTNSESTSVSKSNVKASRNEELQCFSDNNCRIDMEYRKDPLYANWEKFKKLQRQLTKLKYCKT